MLYKMIQRLDKVFSFAQALAYYRHAEYESIENKQRNMPKLGAM